MEVKELSLKIIVPDPTQPRKQYDDSALEELAGSIKNNGVLEPILVRPKGNGYMIVFGERRYRASALAGMPNIPAMIRDMTDEQVLEAQLVENLHRVDPHPMDEAVAFKRFVELKKIPVADIAAKIGKKDYYVKQRLKLNELTLDWQKVFFKNVISLADALKVATLPRKVQENLYEEQVEEDELQNSNYKIDIEDYQISRYKGELQRATFNLADATLDPKAGACNLCPHNTAFQSLFPGDEKSPRCLNISCFNNKTQIAFTTNIKVAKEDPTMVFVSSYGERNAKLLKQLEKDNIPVLKAYVDFKEIEEPEKPDFEEFKEENDELPSEKLNEEFEAQMHQYDQEMQAYKKMIDSGKYVKAFIVDGSEAGKNIYVELVKNKSNPLTNTTITETAQDEIKRLSDTEARAKELDSIKVHNNVKDTLKKNEAYIDDFTNLSKVEIIGLILLLCDSCYNSKQLFTERLKIDFGWGEDKVTVFDAFDNLSDAVLQQFANMFFRRCLLEKLISGPSIEQFPEKHGKAKAVRKVAEIYIPDLVKSFEEEQAAIALKRQAKNDKRITQLLNSLNEEEAPKPAVKKRTKKQAADTAEQNESSLAGAIAELLK